MSFRQGLLARAARLNARVVLPEGEDERIHAAADRLKRGKIAEPIILTEAGLARHPLRDRVAAFLATRSTKHEAPPAFLFGAAMVALGEAEACVAGATRPTADTIRAALRAIGMAPGTAVVSSSFYMVTQQSGPWRKEPKLQAVYTFTDCAVIPDPTPEQLVSIAWSAAMDREKLVGDVPVVAFLSYSTKGSADGPKVYKIREAARLFAEQHPEILSDGEMQLDAALVPEVAGSSPRAARRGARPTSGLPRPRRREHRVQAGAASGRRRGPGPPPAGVGPADVRPVARGHPG